MIFGQFLTIRDLISVAKRLNIADNHDLSNATIEQEKLFENHPAIQSQFCNPGSALTFFINYKAWQ